MSSGRAGRFSAFAAWAGFGVFWGGWGALIPEIKATTGATDAELGVALLFVAAGALLSMPLTGALVDRFGERVLVPALGAFAGAVLLPGLSGSIEALAAALAVVGAASGALDIAMTARVVGIETRTNTRLMSRAHGVFALSAVGASAIVGLLRSADVSLLPILAALAAPIAAVAVLNVPFVRATTARAGRPQPRPPQRITGLVAFLGILYALALMVENALEQWAALHLEETLLATPAVGGIGPALFMLGLFLGRSLAFLYERRMSEWRIIRVAGGTATAAVLLFAFAPDTLIALVAVFLVGIAIAPAAPTIISFVGRAAVEDERGSAISTATTIGYLGYVLGPVVVGGTTGVAGLRVGLVVIAFVSALLVIATLVARPRSRAEAQRPFDPATPAREPRGTSLGKAAMPGGVLLDRRGPIRPPY